MKTVKSNLFLTSIFILLKHFFDGRTALRNFFFIFLFLFCLDLIGDVKGPGIEKGFADPPEQTKPWVYWYWISGNISREGITRDLEAMARVGIGQALIGNVEQGKSFKGAVTILSEKWWKLTEHAISEGKRLGVKIGMFNGPGWSQSGGPWNKPEQSMRYIVSSELQLKGPLNFKGKLKKPCEQFQDVTLLAFPVPTGGNADFRNLSPRITSSPEAPGLANLLDGKLNTVFHLPGNPSKTFVMDLDSTSSFTARSLLLYPGPRGIRANCDLQVKEKSGRYRTIKSMSINRTNMSPSVGPLPLGPACGSFPSVTSTHFRLIFSGFTRSGELGEIKLLGSPRLDSFIQKELGKMFQTPLPMWDAYQWPQPAEAEAGYHYTRPDEVVNISDHLAPDGTLTWKVPEGEWIVIRFGMTPTGVTNAPAAPEGRGLEVDKMNGHALVNHFDSYIGKLLKRMPVSDRKALTRVVADSYETGSENWTDGFDSVFQRTYGYDPKPWLPVFTGRIIGSADRSERFLWDLRRLVADRVATQYVGKLRRLSEQHGLKLWLENYGHWGFPSEFLKYGGQSDRVSGEFWSSGSLGSIECRAASSASHIYGKKIISAEAFTSGGPAWQLHPWALKKRGDWAYTEGINHFVLHVYIEQPWEDRLPGINAWFGIEFNRHNTWFNQSRSWIDYLRRCHFLLQQGLNVADICYFIGEDVPKMTGIRKPRLPRGYNFDYINGEVIKKRLSIKNGRFVLPEGTSYALMVLPELKTMRPELLKKISSLVAEGGIIYGPPPSRSPSMQDYPACDDEVKKLAAEMWRNCDGKKIKSVAYGKGRIFFGGDLKRVLTWCNVLQDVVIEKEEEDLSLEGCSWFWLGSRGFDAALGACYFRGTLDIEKSTPVKKAKLLVTADNSFKLFVNGRQQFIDSAAAGTFNIDQVIDLTSFLKPGRNVFAVEAVNGGDANNPAGLIGRYRVTYADGKVLEGRIDESWRASFERKKGWREIDFDDSGWTPAVKLAVYGSGPWGNVKSRSSKGEKVLWVHRRDDNDRADYYFISNQSDRKIAIKPVFRVSERTPEFWHPASGMIEKTACYEITKKGVRVPMMLQPRGSLFVVFRGAPGARAVKEVLRDGVPDPALTVVRESKGLLKVQVEKAGNYILKLDDGQTCSFDVKNMPSMFSVTGPWKLSFPADRDAPANIVLDQLKSWTENHDPGIRYFSGTATYEKTLRIPANRFGVDKSLFLDLGDVQVIAEVILNGKNLGVLWKPPFVVDITSAAKKGENRLKVKVTNVWLNRRIGDLKYPGGLPGTKKTRLGKAFKSWVGLKVVDKKGTLTPSGMLGPVTIHSRIIVLIRN